MGSAFAKPRLFTRRDCLVVKPKVLMAHERFKDMQHGLHDPERLTSGLV
jgi:hypothetical protein